MADEELFSLGRGEGSHNFPKKYRIHMYKKNY